MEVPANGRETFVVTEKTVTDDVRGFSNLQPHAVMVMLDGVISDNGEHPLVDELRQIVSRINDLLRSHNDLNPQIQKLINGQSRLRENLKSLGATDEEKRLRSRYVNQLDAEESKLAELNKAIKKVDEELTEANRYFHQKVNELTLEKVYE